MNLPLKLPWSSAENRWATIINPIIQLPPNQGILLENIALISGNTVINHKLGVTPQGFIITDQNAAAQIYRSADFNKLTLTLNSNAPVTVSIWVF